MMAELAMLGWFLAVTFGVILVMIWQIEYRYGIKFFKTNLRSNSK
jgi:hypothetical protein